MDWHDIGGFRYGTSDRTDLLTDIHLDTYLNQVRDLRELTIETLKRHRVRAFSASSEAELNWWSVYKCIYAELDSEHGTFLLNNGSWYKIDNEFVARVGNEIAAIPATKVSLRDYSQTESEALYNKRLAASIRGAIVMDKKNVIYGGGKSRIEFCDVLTAKKQMLHVKHYSGSAVLSHLFAQGLVAGTAFLSDAEFRRKLNEKLPPAHRLTNPLHRPRAKEWEVAYVVASSSPRDLRLPFFSRVTLRNAVRTLGSLGFRITLTKVPVV